MAEPFVDYYDSITPYYSDDSDYYASVAPYYTPSADVTDLALGNKQPIDMNFELTVQPGGFIDLNKHEQTFVGDNTNSTKALDVAAYLGSIEVRVITLGPVPNSIEWLYEHHWMASLDADGFAIDIRPLAPIRWSAGATIRLLYNTKPA